MMIQKKHCSGCYNDFYNQNNMGLNMVNGQPRCWSFTEAKLVWKKEVHIDQIPPWNQKAIRIPDCYRRQRYVYVEKSRTY